MKKIVIWDYDGTIVDSRQKNLNVTCKIIELVSGKAAENFPVLKSIDSYFRTIISYRNWRDFYMESFNLDKNQVDQAGILWTEQQIADKTEAPIFPGMKEVIEYFSNCRQGIVSQNSKSIILKNIKKHKLSEYFDVIIGYEEVGLEDQKPNPVGLFTAVNKLATSEKCRIYYIGDQDSDVECADNAKKMLLKSEIEIISIYLNHFRIPFDREKSFKPDFEIFSAQELINMFEN